VVVQAAGLSDAVGFVVAGGRSVRMGQDKALLPWAGGTLLDHAIGLLRDVTPDVRILCGADERYHDRRVPLVVDGTADAGPLAGLDAALQAAEGRRILVLGVDLPFVTSPLLEFLGRSLADWDAVVPVVGSRPQPLCAAYGPPCAGPVRARLAAGERRMTTFWPDVRVREVPESELDAFGAPGTLFRNLNTPEDFDAIKG
jgi:molybdopterin-guanine dinucleotide biosynthesis protein A